jgi:hypothetical protein
MAGIPTVDIGPMDTGPMIAGPTIASPMTVDGFYAFTDTRPAPRVRDIENLIVAFEVLLPSTDERDLRWKRDSTPAFRH